MSSSSLRPATLPVPAITTSAEVVIVGAGVAGLAAARDLDGLDVLVLDGADRVGGRTRVDVIGGDHVSLGAGVVYRGTPTDRLVAELDIPTFPVAPDTYSMHLGGVTVVARTLGELVAGLPLAGPDRAELLAALQRILDDYRRLGGHGLSAEADLLADMTFAEYIGDLSPTVAEILDGLVFAHAMVRSHEISAKYVVRYLSSKLALDATHAGFIRTGMQEIADRLAATSPAVIALGHRVAAVRPEGSHVLVDVDGPGGRTVVEAREVILAVPGPAVAGLVALPEWKTAALERVESVAALIVGVTLEARPDAAWRHVFFVPVLDGAFDYVCTMRVGPDQDPASTSTWQLGAWRERALREMGKTDEEIAREWIDGLETIFPGARDAVLGWSVARWPAGFAIAKSDRRAVLPDVIRAVDGVHFAGDYASESAGTHGAIESGRRAAAEVRERLGG